MKNLLRFLGCALFLLAVPALPAHAQSSGSIVGTVTGVPDGEVLPGVNVVVVGTQQGASTDVNGHYEIAGVEPGTYALRASSIGFAGLVREGVEVRAGERTVVDFQLEESELGLDELVVVGYGAQERRDLTGSVSSVDAEAIAEVPSVSPLEALEGKVAGLNIQNNSGRPGGSFRVNLRGFTSINASNDPLFVIDGVVGANPDFINPDNIASVQVLKDASASAIYGTQAANGVVIIETKGSRPGALRMSYSSRLGASVLSKKIDMLDANQFMEAIRRAYRYDPDREMPDFAAEYPALFNADGTPRYNTNWQEEATRTAVSQRHNVSVSGGSEAVALNLSLGYQNAEGIVRHTSLKKYSARLGANLSPRSWLSLDANLAYNSTQEDRIDDYRVGSQVPTRTMIENFPLLPVRYADGEYARGVDHDFLAAEPRENTVKALDGITKHHGNSQLLGNVDLTADLTDHLSFETTLGVEREQYGLQLYAGRDLINISQAQGGDALVSNTDVVYWQSENFLTYDRTFGDHDVTALVGASWSEETAENVAAHAQDFSDDAYGYYDLGAARNPLPPSSSYTGETLNSYYTRINYRLRGRYLVTVTGRYDGSSKFGSGNKYAFFPSVALGWRLSEEPFLEDLHALSDLKLRFSSGVTGNSSIGAYSALGTTGTYTAVFGDERFLGTAQGSVPNTELRWEKTTQHNLGLDLALFEGRIALATDVYLKTTDDLLLENPLSYVSGYGSVTENVGKTRNYGVEVSLETQNINGRHFQWRSTANVSANRNEILALGDEDADIFPGPYFLGPTNILRVGESVGSFWGFVREGTWNTDEAEEAAGYGKEPGDLKLRDLNDDGTIDDADRKIIGNAYPDFTAYLRNAFEYRNWTLSVAIEASYGNEILNFTHHSIEDRIGYANARASLLDAWTPENQDTPIARLRLGPQDPYDTQVDTRWVEDGSYIRGQTLILAYTLGDALTSRLQLQQARLSASLQNFFLITSYSGYDPEVSTYGDAFAQGIEFFGYPKPRTFSLGVNLQF